MAPCPSVPAAGVGYSQLHPLILVGKLSVVRASALKVFGRYDKVWFSKLGHALRSTRLVTMYDYYD